MSGTGKQPAFKGEEPPEPVGELETWASMQLARDPQAWEGLLSRHAVPRSRLNGRALELLGEPLDGPPIVLTHDLALRLELVRDWLPENGPGPAAEPELAPLSVRIVPLDDFADTPEEGEEAILGDTDNAVIPEAGEVISTGTAEPVRQPS
jgi:hypothetical protein